MSPLLLAGFFVFVLATVVVAGYFVSRREPVEPETTLPAIPAMIGLDPQEDGIREQILGALHTFGEMMPTAKGSQETVQRRLNYAGYRGPSAITSYFGLKYATGFLSGLALAVTAFHSQGGDLWMAFAGGICGMGFGFLIPERFLDYRISSRNDSLRRALPPALDLMVMSLEAGQPIDQAIVLASRGLEKFSPDLARELLNVYLETRASKSRADSIRNLADRNSEPELRKFCTLLLDSDRFGSSLAPTLRQHSKYLRVRFRQRAQEAARKLTVKMVFPVFFLIFPAILVVTLGPAVLMMMKQLKNLFQ